jgi:integrase/recombinase XerD
VKNMRALNRLPASEWPKADRDAFTSAYEPGDVFDDTVGPGAHLSTGSRTMIRCTYGHWLGFLRAKYPEDFSLSPEERITPERVRAFIENLSGKLRPSTVAISAARLYDAARLIAPTRDWSWLRSIKSRLAGLARPMDRFNRLVPPVQTLNFGIELMDAALVLPNSDGKQREIQYRDGLFSALRSLWPVRRRSIAALTVILLCTRPDGHRVFLSLTRPKRLLLSGYAGRPQHEKRWCRDHRQ